MKGFGQLLLFFCLQLHKVAALVFLVDSLARNHMRGYVRVISTILITAFPELGQVLLDVAAV